MLCIKEQCLPATFTCSLLLPLAIAMYSSSFFGAFDSSCGRARVSSMEQHLQQMQYSAGYQQHHYLPNDELSRIQMMTPKSSSNLTVATPHHPLQYGGFVQQGMASLDVTTSPAVAEVDVGGLEFVKGNADNWGDSGIAVTSPRTETSTDIDTDERNQMFGGGHDDFVVSMDSHDRSKERNSNQKTIRRLTQNREAARRSRLRKKAYVQQLENSRLKLIHLEQELHRARQQGVFIASTYNTEFCHSTGGGILAFDLEYARWLDEHQRKISELRAAINSHAGDNELRLVVDSIMVHYDEIFRLKSVAAKSDVFHMLSGMWITPAERCFMWLGGFRSSALLKILASHVEPLTDQQLLGLCNLQQSSQQAEDALSQGMEALQLSITETLASGCLYPSSGVDNVASYMSQMATAMGKLGTLENFLRQADLLRQQTLQQMHRILTTRQAAGALLAINDYFSRLRALSSLWLARPRD